MIEQGEPLYWFIGMYLVFILGILIGAMIFGSKNAQKNGN